MRRKLLLLVIIIFVSVSMVFSQTSFFKPSSNTGSNYLIAITTATNPTINGATLADGDEIGVFNGTKWNDVCFGAIVWKKASTVLVAWGDNPQTSKLDGFSTPSPMFYRIYSKAQRKSYYATAEYQQGSSEFNPLAMPAVLKKLAGTTLVSVEKNEMTPEQFSLLQNYPNPFNPSTIIEFSIPSDASVTLSIFDVTGKEITKLINNENRNIGTYKTEWNGSNSKGIKVSSGIYYYKLNAITSDNKINTQIKSMFLAK